MALRVGIVDFLNSWPLAWSFLQGAHPGGMEPIFLPPSQVADRLGSGDLDLGLIPSVELPRISGLQLVPGLCVAATREVRSVLLISRRPIEEIRRVALDDSSRTSAALVKILLDRVYQVSPEFVTARADPDEMLRECDAALVIGDPALRVDRERYRVLDLAAEWRQWTGLPFVFAVWAVRGEVVVGSDRGPEIRKILSDSLDRGMAELDRVVDRAVLLLGLEADEVRDYLTRNLTYRLGPAESEGLEEYYRLAAEFGFIDTTGTV